MVLADVNVLVGAHRREAARHAECHAWLRSVVASDQAFGISELALSAFVRIVTNPKIYKTPTPLPTAFAVATVLRGHPHAVTISPGVRHWGIFERLCKENDARGNLVTDAYLAALAIESGCEWVTLDGDFARFTGLRWRRPFAL